MKANGKGRKERRSYAHISRERIQSLIKVVHLHEDTSRHRKHEHIRAHKRKLVVPRKREFNRHTKALDRHNRHRAHQRADRDVYERVGPPVPRRDDVDHDERKDEDGEAI